VIALLHSGQATHDGLNPVAFTVIGYCCFIIFRGIVNRSEGTYEGNLPLLYHNMVTIFDVTLARTLLEAAGGFLAFLVLMVIINMLGYANLPLRPLWMLLGIVYVLWLAFGMSLMVVAGTYENHLVGRLVHPFTYFMIPLSGAFYQVAVDPTALSRLSDVRAAPAHVRDDPLRSVSRHDPRIRRSPIHHGLLHDNDADRAADDGHLQTPHPPPITGRQAHAAPG
jgi:ABC-type polysaccharide/polyol phosphate export permease